MKLFTSILIVFCLAGPGAVLAAGDVESGSAKAAVCKGCHGPEGVSVNPLWPNLAGQHEAYLVKQIAAFREGSRTDATMQPFVGNLSDEDIQDLAAFYASRKACN